MGCPILFMMNLSSEPLGAWAADRIVSAAESARPGDGNVPSGAACRELVEAEFKSWSRAVSRGGHGWQELQGSSASYCPIRSPPSPPRIPFQGCSLINTLPAKHQLRASLYGPMDLGIRKRRTIKVKNKQKALIDSTHRILFGSVLFCFKENVTDSCVEDNVSLETADDKQSKLWKHELMGT